MAAGLMLEADGLETFRAALDAAVEAILDGSELDHEILTDGEVGGRDLGLPLAAELEGLGPWGQRFPEPLFDGSFEVIDRRVVGGAHLKMLVRPLDDAGTLDAIAFNRLPEDLPAGGSVRFLYRLAVNRWSGSQSCQLIVDRIVA